MPNALSIVLDDRRMLSEVCGVNDSNLRTMEELLGSRVLSRGNELLLESDDEHTKLEFSRLVQGLKKHIRSGQIPSECVS